MSGLRRSGKILSSCLVNPSHRSTWRSSITPPSLLTCPPAKFASIFLRPKPGNSNPSWLSSSTSEASCLVGIKHLNHNRLPKRLRYFFAQNDEKLGLELRESSGVVYRFRRLRSVSWGRCRGRPCLLL